MLNFYRANVIFSPFRNKSSLWSRLIQKNWSLWCLFLTIFDLWCILVWHLHVQLLSVCLLLLCSYWIVSWHLERDLIKTSIAHMQAHFPPLDVGSGAKIIFPNLHSGCWLCCQNNFPEIRTSETAYRLQGGIPGNSWCGCATQFSKSWPHFRPQNYHFPHQFSDLASKIHTCFQTWCRQKLCYPYMYMLYFNANKKIS